MTQKSKKEYNNINKTDLYEKRKNSRGQQKVLLNLILTEK